MSTQLKIWTRSYKPFIMGGDVHRPVATTVMAEGPFAVGNDVFVYLVLRPDGKLAVCESTTGAIVGDTLDGVKEDISAADPDVIRKQLEDLKQKRDYAEEVEPAEFWKAMKVGR